MNDPVVYSRLPKRVAIGYVAEEYARAVTFDISEMLDQLPDSTPTILFLRPGQPSAYVVFPMVSGSEITWTVTAIDTAYPGLGACQIMLSVDDDPEQVLLSQVIPVDVGDSLATGGEEPPEGYDSWYAQATAALAKLSGLTVSAEQGTSAQATLTEVGGYLHIDFTLPRGEQGPQGPAGSLTSAGQTITLDADGWDSAAKTQTVEVLDVTATSHIIVTPHPEDRQAYTDAGIACTAQGAASLTFTAKAVPLSDVRVNLLIL